MTPLEYATVYLCAGWLPIPLVPNEKRGAVKYAHMMEWTPPFDVLTLLNPWHNRPDLGVGILLKPSGLIVVDADSDAAVQEVIANCEEPCANIVKTRQGIHCYYKRPAHCPPLRAIQRGASGKIDVLGDGLIVAPGSVHKSGFVYEWVRHGPLQEAPDWAVGLLMAIRERSYVSVGVDPSKEPPRRLTASESARVLAADKRVYYYLLGQGRPEDRSRALWLTMNCLIRMGYDDATIANLIWFSPLGEKPQQRGIAWLGDELARARLELTP